jgi:hypothetical protein
MMTATLDLIVNMYRLIPPSARGLWKRNGSTSHRTYGGWELIGVSMSRTYSDPEQANRGRRAAIDDWTAGTVRTSKDVCFWEHSSYGLAYVEEIRAAQAEFSWHPSKSEIPDIPNTRQ